MCRALSWLTSLLQRSAREGYHSLGRWKLLGAINGFFPGCPQEWNCKPGMTMKGVAHGQKIMLKYLPCLCHPQGLELSPFLFFFPCYTSGLSFELHSCLSFLSNNLNSLALWFRKQTTDYLVWLQSSSHHRTAEYLRLERTFRYRPLEIV